MAVFNEDQLTGSQVAYEIIKEDPQRVAELDQLLKKLEAVRKW